MRAAANLVLALSSFIGCATLACESSDVSGVAPGTGGGKGRDSGVVPAPSGLSLPSGYVLSLDKSPTEYTTAIDGTTAKLVSVLASPGGKRRIEIRDKGGVAVLAPAAWNLPPHGAADPSGGVLACWNTLTGDAQYDTMPHPTLGMTLSCRLTVSMKPHGAVVLPTGPAKGNWLVAVRYEAGSFVVRQLRDETGWLVGSPSADDGIYDIPGDGRTFSDPVLVRKGSLVP